MMFYLQLSWTEASRLLLIMPFGRWPSECLFLF